MRGVRGGGVGMNDVDGKKEDKGERAAKVTDRVRRTNERRPAGDRIGRTSGVEWSGTATPSRAGKGKKRTVM